MSENDRAQAIESWAQRQDWRRVRAVVVVGLDLEVLRIVARRSPRPVVLFDTRPLDCSYADLEVLGVAVSTSAADLQRRLVELYQERQMIACLVCDDAEAPLFERANAAATTRARVRLSTGCHFAQQWTDTLLDLLPRLRKYTPLMRAARPFAERGRRVPGYVVAAGPSLDGNIDELKRARGLICAVNSSVGALRRAGIVPHMVAVLEAQDMSAQLRDLSPEYRRLLVSGVHTHPAVRDLEWRRRLLAVHDCGDLSHWLSDVLDEQEFGIGGSVAMLAFMALVILGCDPIVLVGQDCAGTAHATGSGLDKIKLAPEAMHTITAWGGDGEVETTVVLDTYRLWYEETASALAGHRRLVNATEGGARIGGFEELALRDVVAELADVDDDATLEELEQAIDQASPIDMRAVKAALERAQRAAQKAAKSTYHAERAARDYAAANDSHRRKLQRAPLLLAESQTALGRLTQTDPLERTIATYETVRAVAERHDARIERALRSL
jgi:hypothetical protein